jgi:hypothetical protein
MYQAFRRAKQLISTYGALLSLLTRTEEKLHHFASVEIETLDSGHITALSRLYAVLTSHHQTDLAHSLDGSSIGTSSGVGIQP